MRISVASAVFFLLLAFPTAHAKSNHDDLTLDPAALAQMETRADHAGVREQCYLYTELVQVYTEVAGRQISAGEMEQANTTLKRIQHFTALIHAAIARDTKHVKDAEKMVHMATYHLDQYMHRVSSDDKAVVESTKKELDKVHEELLAQVFSH
jgi:hypothetical protein